MSIINNTNPQITPITITSTTPSTPTLLSTPSSYSSPSPPSLPNMIISSHPPPSINNCDQGGVFINNINYEIGLEMIGGNNGVVVGSNDNVINNINNNINGINNDLSSNQLDQQQQSNAPNYLTSYRQSSSTSNIYFLAKTNQNQLLGINCNDNSNDNSSKIIVPTQHHQQPLESNDNNNNGINNTVNQSHQQLQFQQLQPNFHHIPYAQLTTRSSAPNFHGSSYSSTIIDSNKIINKQLDKSDKKNQRSMPNIQFHAKAHKNINISDNINNVGSNNNISNVSNPIFLMDHLHNNSLSTPNTPTLLHSEQNDHNNHNGNNSNFPLSSSSSLLKPSNQIPRKGHWRKRSLSAPTPSLTNQAEQSGFIIPSLSLPSLHHHHHHHHHHQQQRYCHLYHHPINCLPISSPFPIRKPHVSLPPIQIQRNPKHSQSTPSMSSEECQRKLNEELEKVDFDDITVSELKELLRLRGKPATGKKSILMQRLQEEIELVKAMKNCAASNNKDENGNNNNTGNNNIGNNNTINTTNTNSNDDDDDDQQQQQSHQQFEQQYQPMITSQTSKNSTLFAPPTLNSTVNPNGDDVPFPNNCMTVNNNATGDWPDVNFSLLQQNINDPNNTTSQYDFLFQKHPPTSATSAPAVKPKFDFASLTNNHNDIVVNDNIVIKDEEMNNSDNSGNGYNIYNQQSSTAPPVFTEFSNFGFTNPHPHHHGDLSFQPNPQNNHHFLNLYNNNNNQQQHQQENLMIKIEENNMGILNYPSTTSSTATSHILTQQLNQNHIPMQIEDVSMSFGEVGN